MACKCYHAERNFLGKIGVCWGTKECESCSCGGDESKCDFYEDKRKKATLKITNADRFRAMMDDMQLAIFFASVSGCPYDREIALDKCESWSNACVSCWQDWLKQEVKDAT